MAKKINLEGEQLEVFTELKKLAKRANQRLVRLERLTGEQGTFASKQLYDYLGIESLNAISKTGRIRVSKQFTIQQMLAITKATEQFLKDKGSTVAGVKKLKIEYEKQAGVKLDLKHINTIYRSRKNYTWIYEYIPKSEFWGVWVPVTKKEGWDKETFTEQIAYRIGKEIDVELKQDLEDLYYYVIGS